MNDPITFGEVEQEFERRATGQIGPGPWILENSPIVAWLENFDRALALVKRDATDRTDRKRLGKRSYFARDQALADLARVFRRHAMPPTPERRGGAARTATVSAERTYARRLGRFLLIVAEAADMPRPRSDDGGREALRIVERVDARLLRPR